MPRMLHGCGGIKRQVSPISQFPDGSSLCIGAPAQIEGPTIPKGGRQGNAWAESPLSAAAIVKQPQAH